VVSVPPEASLRKVDLALELQILSFYRQRDAVADNAVADSGENAAGGPPHPIDTSEPVA
jgi:hypothetical protein